MKQSYMLSLLLLLVTCYLSATPIGQTFKVDRYNVQSGLPSNRVNCIAQDDNGFIWLAASSGLVRFDGTDFFDFNTASLTKGFFYKDEVVSLDVKDDLILILHDASAELYNQRTGDVRILSDTLLISNNLRAARFVGDDVLIGGVHGLFCYHIPDGTYSQIESLDQAGHNVLRNVRDIFVDNTLTTWVATVRHGIFYKLYGSKDFLPVQALLPENCFATSFALCNGRLFIGTWDDGIYVLSSDSHGVVAEHIDTNDLGWVLTYSISFDQAGNLWVGTPEGIRVVSLNGEKPSLIPFAQETGTRKAREVKSTFADRDGNIWYTDQGNGIVRASYASDVVREINFLDLGLPYSEVTAIHVDGNDILWAGINGAGLVRYDLRKGELLKDNKVLSGISKEANGVVCIYEMPQTGQILLCTRYFGVYCLDMRGDEPVSISHVNVDRRGLRYNFTLGAEKAAGNDVWIATTKGLVLLHSTGAGFEYIEPVDLNGIIENDQVESLLNDSNGNLWIATRTKGLFRVTYDYLNGTPINSERYLADDSLNADNRILCIHEDSHRNIWIGGNRFGLMLYDMAQNRFYQAENSSSLPSDCVCSIVEDAKGILWVSTDCGFACYDLSSESKVVVSSKVAGDMENVTFLPRSVWYSDGTVMFGGYRGISICNPDMMLRNELVNAPFITELSVSDVDRKSLDELPPYTSSLKMKHNHRDLFLKFSSICRNADRVLYAYKLSGIDKGWKYVGAKERGVSYVNLKPGHYTFRVKASSAPGVWTEETILKIHVKSSPWILYVALMSLLLVALAVAVYIYKRKKEEAERDLISFREEVARQSIPLSGTDLDKQFIAKVVKVIEENLSDPDLDVDFLNSAMNMSNSTLYRKIKTITGLATKEFIRQTRYKYACKYLLEKSSNISDVAYRVGFANAKYFSQCFKKEFGKTPSQYIQENNKQNNNEKDLL